MLSSPKKSVCNHDKAMDIKDVEEKGGKKSNNNKKNPNKKAPQNWQKATTNNNPPPEKMEKLSMCIGSDCGSIAFHTQSYI